MGCYIHIPFCEKICSYCDFCKVFYKEEFAWKYLRALVEEIKESYDGKEIDTIYIGGGTPSVLTLEQLQFLFSSISNILTFSKKYEYTVECNFSSTNYEKLDCMKKYGVNRLSFGLESTLPKNLSFLEREEDTSSIFNILNYCKKIGISNINVDLIYALPNQTISDLKKDLSFLKKLPITHLSTYSLMIEEHTKLSIAGIKPISEELDRLMYDVICQEFSSFDHYEISNFAKSKKYRSLHNMKYWKNQYYYGFGLSASGYEGNVRYTKTRSFSKYFMKDYIKDNGIEFLNKKDKIEYEVLLSLRMKEGINLIDFFKKYGDFSLYYAYDFLLSKGLLVLSNNHLFIPEDLWYISNSIIVQLLEGECYERSTI